MLLVLPVDLDDDLGRKTGIETPVVGRAAVREAAVALATADPEDSDVNVLFQAIKTYDEIVAEGVDEEVEVAVVTGVDGSDVAANRAVGEEVDTVLASLTTGETVRSVLVTDGAQDESVFPVIRSRVPIDSTRRVVVRQAQDLESIYYTIKQVLDDPETRGTILVPLGILLLIYPATIGASVLDIPGAAVLGLLSGLLGLYSLFHGLGLEETVDNVAARLRRGLYAGRLTIVTYAVAVALILIGVVEGAQRLETVHRSVPTLPAARGAAVFVYASVRWFAVAGVTTSLGRVTDEYLTGSFQWRYVNAPFYVLAIGIVLHGLSGYFLPGVAGPTPISNTRLAVTLTAGTLLGVLSTLTFAVAESRYGVSPEPQ
jgi:putative membrane protein